VAQSPVDRIAALLDDDDLERRIAAAIVLGALRVKAARAVAGLRSALTSPYPALQRHAATALGEIGADKATVEIVPLLASRDRAVREAAEHALLRFGEAVVPHLEGRLSEAGPDERRAIEAVLARLGGKNAFGALLASLDGATEEEAAAAAVAMRGQARSADARTKRSYLAQLEKLLTGLSRREGDDVAALRAVLKMMGYLEDPRAVPTLQTYAADPKQPAAVRQEALIALRFTVEGAEPSAKLLRALVAAAGDDDRSLAQTALITLAGLPLPAKIAGELDPLLAHPDLERARVAIDLLAHRKEASASAALVSVVESHDLRRARIAAEALRERADAVVPLAEALARGSDPERVRLLGRVLRPHARSLTAAQRRKLREHALGLLESGSPAWQPALDVAREAAPDETATALRALYDKLRRRKNGTERAGAVLRALCRSDAATDEDRYQLASRLLAEGRHDTTASARRDDEALELVEQLVKRGFDVAGALRRDRTIMLETLYYVGFHFIERRHPLGQDLLEIVLERAGRKKIGKMARNKLELASPA
jgi:HEAT repeat protein